MFAKATKNFLREVDTGGNLTAVSNLNDSDKLQLLSLVTKKRRFWCWQKPKYQFLSVTLGDVLTEDQILSPVVVESDFVKYEGRFENHTRGALKTALGKAKLTLGGKGFVESQSSFGTLRKQEVDLQQLIRDAQGRTIDLKNPVLQQVLERKNEVLCVLTQKIVTTQQCVISEHVQMEKCGVVGIQLKTVQVSVMDRGNISKGSNVVLEIPAPTTLAYGVIELYLRVDGQFEFCLLQEKHGGFQQTRESSCASLEPLPLLELGFWDMTDALQGASVVDEPLGVLKQVTWLLKRNVHPFAELPEPQQTALNDVLQEVLFDEEMLVVLEQVCDSVASSRLLPPLAGLGELKPSQQQQLMAFLQLAGCSVQGGVPDPEDVVSNRKLFSTAYLLVSALAEMPDNAAVLLGTCCKLQIIPTLCHLLYALSDEGMSDLEDPMLAPLKDAETLEIVQHLFALADINLEMLQSSVQATASKDPAVLPLILYISLNGLCALGRAH
ncbi:non-syndromic hearing impairment protein 5 [Sus scrofa]|uniref:Gasdermin E n=1 Tax=Sus scrofa TaxID=9823 RepID=F1ST94_PIG|nr:non-syndromic hearing impairment protein 5 [Sus scrofa]XP_005673375.2 non-syndromic hearing impairment protein 5 [Sus scrofa]XP_005673376.2 non-syndromic hearing impairment protein 5 [Sus scrofa]XP_013841242.2 non-syndromic hearing impairment protein 5 [Sus scrofa]XP_020934333.1 non-syndromic hearing impairment protein 5 [Sus scrofa]XP_020934334.1 non-syndromic hearing impairment protein 5 [Sus scrofa]XP_020934335.1 non-syndromic hearing impairment protein 5 [Sus scrofa]